MIDLQDLADAPGFGAAKRTLMKEGLWDEYRGLEAKPYRVNVEYSIRDSGSMIVTVNARTEQEALDKACDKVEGGVEYSIEINDAEVMP